MMLQLHAVTLKLKIMPATQQIAFMCLISKLRSASHGLSFVSKLLAIAILFPQVVLGSQMTVLDPNVAEKTIPAIATKFTKFKRVAGCLRSPQPNLMPRKVITHALWHG